MGARRAVLIGVPKNKRDPDLNLPVVYNDISLLQIALEACGYVVNTHGIDDPSEVSYNLIQDAIADACIEAQTDSTLLIYFTGHGIHFNGKDLLVPWDGHFADPSRIERCLVSTDISSFVDRSRARLVMFFVDACREGIQWETKSISVQGWGRAQRQEEGRRFVLVYSCRPGELSQYVSGSNGFSLFSKALSTALAPESPAETIGEIVRSTQEELDKLVKEHGKNEQHIRIAGEQELSSQYLSYKISDGHVIEGSTRGADADWGEAVIESRLWRLAGTYDNDGGSFLISHTNHLVAACEEVWTNADKVLPADPWRDHTYPLRVLACLELLANSLPQINLSPVETCILITAPFIREAVYSCAVVNMALANPLDFITQGNNSSLKVRRRLEMTHAAHPQLIRKAHRSQNREAGNAIAFWLMHRSIMRDPDIWQVEPDGYISMEFSAVLKSFENESSNINITRRQLIEFAQCLGCDPARIGRGDRTYVFSEKLLIETGAISQEIREQLLGYLLCIAGWMALDIRAMSDILPDHVGIADPIDPSSLNKSLRGANWRTVGTGRSVEIKCPHPAIDYSIRELVIRANEVLSETHRRAAERSFTLECLRNLPSRLGTELIKPEVLNEKAAYETPHLNFQLSNDEVRELLMGEQLYVRPELAIRELYQNALDACRYRSARLQYLERTGQLESANTWQGRIEFEQGTDRLKGHYIECRDNGIGMSRRELESCFAKAGKRFCDLPEFIEEQNEWLRCHPPIRLYPNSQFGVGVFSYFMLADEIEIETCRFDRKGRSGTRLLITIPGSGSLFRIQEFGTGREAGTRIRLYLKETKEVEKISCVKVLASLLWVSEFNVNARHGKAQTIWESGVLKHPENPRTRFPKDPELPIWWTTEKGHILADGIEVAVDDDEELTSTGIVVNLTSEYKPRLTIDRRKALYWDKRWVRESAAISVRCISDWEDISYMWLWTLLMVLPECEKIINEDLKLKNREIPMKGRVEGVTLLLSGSPNYNRRSSTLSKLTFKRTITLGINLYRTDIGDIDPADIGLSRIRISDIGVLRKDAFLWPLVYEAWVWELQRHKHNDYPRYKLVGNEVSLDPAMYPHWMRLRAALSNKEIIGHQELEFQVRLSYWDKEIGDGVARLEAWQRIGLVLPSWLVKALNNFQDGELSRHYLFGYVPKSGLALHRMRYRATHFILKLKLDWKDKLSKLVVIVFTLIILYLLIIGAIALTKYVRN